MTTDTSIGTAPSGLPADARPQLVAAVEQAVRLIGVARPEDAAKPTPCTEYDVAHLVGHLLAVLRRVTHVAAGGHAFDVPSIVLDVSPQDWSGVAEQRARELAAAWRDDAVLDRVLHLPFGDVPGRGAAVAYVQELTTHSWDLAAALNRRDLLDDGLAAVALVAAKRFVPDSGRGQIPFDPVVPLADDEPVYDRLVAWLGRDPRWSPA